MIFGIVLTAYDYTRLCRKVKEVRGEPVTCLWLDHTLPIINLFLYPWITFKPVHQVVFVKLKTNFTAIAYAVKIRTALSHTEWVR